MLGGTTTRQVFLSMEGAIANLSLSWRRGDFARLCGWVVSQRGLEGATSLAPWATGLPSAPHLPVL